MTDVRTIATGFVTLLVTTNIVSLVCCIDALRRVRRYQKDIAFIFEAMERAGWVSKK